MIISRFVAKRRIAEGKQTRAADAYLLVFIDMVLLIGFLSFLFVPLMYVIYAAQPSDGSTLLFLMVLYICVPLWVLIRGIVWANRSRRVAA